MTTPRTPASPVAVTLVGGPTVLLEHAGLRVLSDPTFDAPRQYEGRAVLTKLTGPAVPAAAVLPVDVVLVSHDQHADNLDVAGRALVEEALAAGRPVLSTPRAAERIPGVTGLAPWESWDSRTTPSTRITAVPALHGPPGADADALSGPVTGFVLEAPEQPTVYVSGDNASLEHVREVGERFAVDVAVLHAGAARVPRHPGATLTLDAAATVAAARLLPGATVVPVHADSWAHFSEDVDAVRRAFADAGLSDRLHPLQARVRSTIER
ncbi:MBL fold metallo-hydrolase [Luteimicrobium subarcticum]|uniref:L-ascorbate metabolism protein UlaG (Beta-lactamase superfamily) n=1 Tax=Luteimicrobium subarcticum TaxID=620910 RepID=A0A2M8WJ94_9MICO|nr:MBL fold metallo-hydrolase [Luteimicrobium subarcticum]PJI91005.1 L-ascorbate metabolism protein UlaG (beta-lactamase superfamily) [Luteimicrobium subarcticum]